MSDKIKLISFLIIAYFVIGFCVGSLVAYDGNNCIDSCTAQITPINEQITTMNDNELNEYLYIKHINDSLKQEERK